MSTLCNNSNKLISVNSSEGLYQQACDHASQTESKKGLLNLPRRLFSSMQDYIVTRYNQHIDRQAFNYLLSIDDSLLKDIGVTRGDINWASQLPLSEDAAKEIEKIARRR